MFDQLFSYLSFYTFSSSRYQGGYPIDLLVANDTLYFITLANDAENIHIENLLFDNLTFDRNNEVEFVMMIENPTEIELIPPTQTKYSSFTKIDARPANNDIIDQDSAEEDLRLMSYSSDIPLGF